MLVIGMLIFIVRFPKSRREGLSLVKTPAVIAVFFLSPKNH